MALPKPMESTHRARLSSQGRLVGYSALTLTLAGLVSSIPVATALGTSIGTLLLAGQLIAQARQAHLRTSGSSISKGLSCLSHAPLKTTTGNTLELDINLTLTAKYAFRVIALEPQTVGGLVCHVEGDGGLSLKLTPTRIGYGFLHGLRVRGTTFGGLFELAYWAPYRVRVQGLPRLFPAGKGLTIRTARATARAQASVMSARRRGFGLELRELRDYQSGDSFKHIAWRATARRGKVVSREFESDLSVSAWIALDVSPSMFWGPSGKSRIDYAMETAYGLLSMMARMGQPCGMSLFDTEVRHVVASGAGRGHLRRATTALLEINSLVHEERTEVSSMELIQHVSRWFQTQENLHFHITDTPYADTSSLDLARLASAARRKVYEYIENEHDGRPIVPIDEYAQDPNQSLFRAFARYAGVSLPLEQSPRPGGQSLGLAAALEGILERPGGPHTVVVISDLYTATDLELVRRAALALRRQRHNLVVFCPSDPSFETFDGTPQAELQAALGFTANLATQQRLREARAALHPAGVSFLHCGPRDVLGRLLERLRRVA